MTEELFRQDAYQKTCEATVVAVDERQPQAVRSMALYMLKRGLAVEATGRQTSGELTQQPIDRRVAALLVHAFEAARTQRDQPEAFFRRASHAVG